MSENCLVELQRGHSYFQERHPLVQGKGVKRVSILTTCHLILVIDLKIASDIDLNVLTEYSMIFVVTLI